MDNTLNRSLSNSIRPADNTVEVLQNLVAQTSKQTELMTQVLQGMNGNETNPRNPRKPIVCFQCGKPGHIRSQCYSAVPDRPNNRTIICHFCSKPGHLANNCYARARMENADNDRDKNAQDNSSYDDRRVNMLATLQPTQYPAIGVKYVSDNSNMGQVLGTGGDMNVSGVKYGGGGI